MAVDKRACAREGCDREVRNHQYRCCSVQCSVVDKELAKTESVCREVGGSYTADLWAAAVTYSDALTEFRRAFRDTYRRAMTDGFPKERWSEIQRV